MTTAASPSRRAIDTRAAKTRIRRERLMDSAFAAYLQDIDAYPLLDAAGERTLGHALRAGSPSPIGAPGPITRAAHQAREGLILSNLRLVLVVAACYADRGVPLLDIVQAGNMGLMRAVDKYKPGRARFSTHATWWIREACSRYVMGHASLIHIPRGVLEQRGKIRKITGDALRDNGVALDVETTATRVALTPSQVRNALDVQEYIDSTERVVVGSDGHAITLGDTIADDQGEPLEVRVARDDAADELYKLLATVLTPRERITIGMRYGLGELDGKVCTYAQIAKALGTTSAIVKGLEKQAIEKLRDAYAKTARPGGLLIQFPLFATAAM